MIFSVMMMVVIMLDRFFEKSLLTLISHFSIIEGLVHVWIKFSAAVTIFQNLLSFKSYLGATHRLGCILRNSCQIECFILIKIFKPSISSYLLRRGRGSL